MFHQDSLENVTATIKYKSWNLSDVYFVFTLHAQHRSVGRLVHHDWDLITNEDISICSSTFTTGKAEKKVYCPRALRMSSWKWHRSCLLLFYWHVVWPCCWHVVAAHPCAQKGKEPEILWGSKNDCHKKEVYYKCSTVNLNLYGHWMGRTRFCGVWQMAFTYVSHIYWVPSCSDKRKSLNDNSYVSKKACETGTL